MTSSSPTTADKLMIVPLLVRTVASALIRLIINPFSSGPKANTLLKDVAFAALRTNLSNTSVGTEQWMKVPTDTAYLDFAKKQGFQPDTDVLGSGLKVH